MRLMEIMTTGVRTVPVDQPAAQALQRMRIDRIHHLVAMDGQRVAGVLSRRDVGRDAGDLTVGDLMTAPVVTASPRTTLREAANLMRARGIGCIPVVDGRKVVGIVTVTDLLELLGRGDQPAPRVSGRYKAASGSRWKPVRRAAREVRYQPERPGSPRPRA